MTILEESEKQPSPGVQIQNSAKIIPSSANSPPTKSSNLATSPRTSVEQPATAVAVSTASVGVANNNNNAVSGAKNHILNSMISNVADRYITPEYLAPLPSSVSFFT